MTTTTYRVHIIENERGNPPGKLAEAELHFTEAAGPLAGMKLIGFAVWERRSRPGDFNVTYPARQYAVNGERRSFALLRPVKDPAAGDAIRDSIIDAWKKHCGGACASCGHTGGPAILPGSCDASCPRCGRDWPPADNGQDEAQPAIPGAGDVRGQELATPTVADAPFSLTPPANDGPTAAAVPLPLLSAYPNVEIIDGRLRARR